MLTVQYCPEDFDVPFTERTAVVKFLDSKDVKKKYWSDPHHQIMFQCHVDLLDDILAELHQEDIHHIWVIGRDEALARR